MTSSLETRRKLREIRPTGESAARSPQGARLPLVRDLGFWGTISVVVGLMIGTGVYLKPSEMAREAGSAGLMMAAWIAAGLLCILGALIYAELASTFPETGGDYAYLRRGLGPLWAFLYGWRSILMTIPASLAGYGAGIVLFIGFLWPGVQQPIGHWEVPLPFGASPVALTVRWSHLFGVAPIIIFTGINYLRIRDVGRVQIGLTILKTIALIAVIAIGLGFLLVGHPDPTGSLPPAAPVSIRQPSLGGLLAAITASLWAYSGWHMVGRVGGEVQKPGTVLPRAIIGGFLFTAALFVLVTLCYLGVLSFPRVAASTHVASDMIQTAAGPQVAGLLTIVMIVSVLGTMNANLLTASRVPFAMARDSLFFPTFARVNPERRVPTTSVTLTAMIGIFLVLTGTFEEVTALLVFGSWGFHGLTTVALFRLRSREPDLPRPYRVWGYPIVPALFVLCCVVLTVSIIIEHPTRSLAGVAVILIGIPVYRYWSRRPNASGPVSESASNR